jgi:presenilin-like A22 family membrane protease
MKHNLKVTIVILAMFLITQFIGLYVITQYSPITQVVYNPQTGNSTNVTFTPPENQLPFGQTPQLQTSSDFLSVLPSLIISFALVILLIFVLMKFKLSIIIKIWFFGVVIISLWITLNAILKNLIPFALGIALIIAVVLAVFKVFRPRVIVHNATELLIYPGIAAIFVPLFNWWSVIILLLIISVYDMWAVWKSGIMQKMAKFQMEEVGVFGGFFIPYASKKVKAQIQRLKLMGKKKAERLGKKIKVSLAILGGGDVVFPLIAAGVFMNTFGIVSALFVIVGALSALVYLLLQGEKNKHYPAMPYLTTGILIGLLIWRILVF